MTHQHTEARNHFPKKQGTLTGPHYIFCGTRLKSTVLNC